MRRAVAITDRDVIGPVARVGPAVSPRTRSLNGEGGPCRRRPDPEVLDTGFPTGYINFMVTLVAAVNRPEDVVGWMSPRVDDHLDRLGHCALGQEE